MIRDGIGGLAAFDAVPRGAGGVAGAVPRQAGLSA
jgi:hypothetical protein